MPITVTQNSLVETVAAGSPFEMGVAQGKCLREKIHAARNVLNQLEAFRLMKPGWMPFPLFRRICEGKAAHALGLALRDFPDATQRLEGISAGSGVELRTLFLFAAMESMMSDTRRCTAIPSLGGCSALAIRGKRSATGDPVIVRNFDYIPMVRPLYTMRRTQPSRGLRSLDFTMAPFAGAVDGVNEKGLCITYNYAYTTDVPENPSAPISIVIADALQRCATISEAASWIQSRPRWGGGILMLADAEGGIASLELSSTRSKLRIPSPDEDFIYHTNVFCTEDMRKIQIPDEAVYSPKAPEGLRGRAIHESAVKRKARFEEILEPDRPLNLENLERIMSDHGRQDSPADTTICVHGPYWTTTASLQLFPRFRRIRVAYDYACRAQHEEIAL